MTAKEELERIICERCFERKECYGRVGHGEECGYRTKFAQTILDAKFVRLEDVEIDERKLLTTMCKQQGVNEYHHQRDLFVLKDIVKAILQAKGIIKGKEE